MRILLVLFLIFSVNISCGLNVYGQDTVAADNADDAVVEPNSTAKINDVIQKIYDETVAAKAKYKELADFDEKCLAKNQDGFLTITYETQVPAAGGKTSLYAFKLDVEPITAKTYKMQDGYFNYPLPLLDLQFSGYVIKHPLRRQFNVVTVLDKYATDLADYQQQFMPLRFLIIPEQDVYKIGEPIRFKAVLANVSKGNILVSGLSKDTLFFTLNDAFWGTSQGEAQTIPSKEMMRQQRQKAREAHAQERALQRKNRGAMTTIIGKRTQVGDKLILRSDEALTIDFVGEGYKRAQDVEIRGIYQLNIKGLKPTAKVTVKIE